MGYEEKRDHKRVNIAMPGTRAHCRALNTGAIFTATPKDLSAGGMGFYYHPSVNLSRGAPIKIQMTIPFMDDKIKVVGELMWWSPAGMESGMNLAGIRFVEVDNVNKVLLREFLLSMGVEEETWERENK